MNLKENIFGFETEFQPTSSCNAWVAAAVLGGSAVSALATGYAANRASETQSANAQRVSDMQQKQYQQTREDLSPYRAIGEDASGRMTTRLSELTTPISVKPQDFLDSDYYKFLENQGTRGVQNSAAFRGLGKSGAALKGTAAFLKGLNSQEWMNNFQMQNTNQTNAFSRLKSLIDTGAGAATGTGALGEKAAYNSGTALTGGANAEAAGINRIGSSVAGLANNIGGYAMYQGMYGNQSDSNSIRPNVSNGIFDASGNG